MKYINENQNIMINVVLGVFMVLVFTVLIKIYVSEKCIRLIHINLYDPETI